MVKEGYEPLTSIQSSDVEDAKQYAQASQPQCCKVKRCRVGRVLGLLALAVASFILTGMIFGPRHHHHPWGPHHGPHGPVGPHGRPDGFDDPREAAMSMAAFELEAAAGPMVWDRRRVFSVVKGPAADNVSSLEWRGLRSFVVVLLGKDAPQRRAPDQPFLTTDPPGLLPLEAINKAAAAYEASVNRTLFPIKIQLADMAALAKQASRNRPDDMADKPCDKVRPYVVYDVARGTLLVDAQLLSGLQKLQQVQAVVSASAAAFLEHLSGMLAQRFGPIDPGMVFEMAATASGVAVAAAFASAVPMWYCLACPAVLGLAMPLAINLGLGEMVNVICDHFNFGPEQCMDLGVAALAVGFVLALASALPIFKVCKMYECEHRPPSAAATSP